MGGGLFRAELGGGEPLPFPSEVFAGKGRHKLFGLVTNRTEPGDEVIWWLRERCGKSEEAHAVQKDDLAGGTLPSGRFGANAAWWAIMILAHNLNCIMKRLVLGPAWSARRMKALRFHLIALPGRVSRHARGLFIRLPADHPGLELLLAARCKILALAGGPRARARPPVHSRDQPPSAAGAEPGCPRHGDRTRIPTASTA